MDNRSHEYHQIEIGGYYLTLLAKVGRTADDVVLAVLYLAYEPMALVIDREHNIVANSYRICAPYALETEGALDFALKGLAVTSLHLEPAACILYYKSFHCKTSLIV
jgi:hypothetical protein